MASADYSLATIQNFVGRELGVTDSVVVDQRRIEQFAHCTEDSQWIHVDPERARAETDFGGTIAHGFLCLSLLGATQTEMVAPPDARRVINYGLDKVRFLAPVMAGSELRARIELLSAEVKGPGRVLVKTRSTVEIMPECQPALVAEILVLLSAA